MAASTGERQPARKNQPRTDIRPHSVPLTVLDARSAAFAWRRAERLELSLHDRMNTRRYGWPRICHLSATSRGYRAEQSKS